MEHSGDAGRIRRLRAARDAAVAQVRAVEAVVAEWERAAERMEAPDGFFTHEDAGTAAAAIRHALASASR
jgi:hypothetical protein